MKYENVKSCIALRPASPTMIVHIISTLFKTEHKATGQSLLISDRGHVRNHNFKNNLEDAKK